MKYMIAAILAATLLAAGCAGTTTASPKPDQDALLLQCRAKADTKAKARYTPEWEAEVKKCLEQNPAE